METHTDRSYGVIPLRWSEGRWQVLLINQYSRIGDNTYWVFPKGHAEGEESSLEAAQRELFEETGMRAERVIEEPIFSFSYQFSFSGKCIDKTVVFYLGLIKDGVEPVLDPEEVRDAGWFALDEVRERLDYDDTKKLYDRVRMYVENHADLLL